MKKQLHIVCLDAPAPPNYGGAIDMYYKIKALAEQDIAITLHYFAYKAGRDTAGLEPYCTKIFAYKRGSFFKDPTFSKPHIVASRINKKLIERLNADENAILLEGIHCTGVLPYLKNKKRKVAVRLHNDEAAYYRHLAKAETNVFKRAYYAWESRQLERYQKTLPQTACYAGISQSDITVFENTYGLKHVILVPAFVPWSRVSSQPGTGTYCLYHGNLAVAENRAAVQWLIQHVFSKTAVPLVIAGKHIPANLKRAAASHPNIAFKQNPTEHELATLIQNAQVHVLPDLNTTGVKLKVLHALFCGRFCITNSTEFQSSNTVAFARTPQEYMDFIKSFMQQEFDAAVIQERENALLNYNNRKNAALLTSYLW